MGSKTPTAQVGGKDAETKNCFVMVCIYTYIYIYLLKKHTSSVYMHILDAVFIEKETRLFCLALAGDTINPQNKSGYLHVNSLRTVSVHKINHLK